MIQPSLLKKIHGNYRFARENAVTDPVLLGIAREYEDNIGRKITTVRAASLASRFTGDEKVLLTTKYDGEGTMLYYEKNAAPTPEKPEIFLFNAHSGRVRVGLPCLEAAKADLEDKNITRALLRVELYLPDIGAGKRRPNHADVAHVSAKGTASDIGQLSLAVLSILALDQTDWRVYNNRREMIWNQLGEIFSSDDSNLVHRAEGEIIAEKDVTSAFAARIKAGKEGCVIYRLTRSEAIKVKPDITVDAAVIGYVEGEMEGQYGVRSILTALTYGETGHTRHFQTFARIYSRMDDATAVALLPRLQAMQVAAPITLTDSDGRTIRFVKPGLIVEVEGDEIIEANNDTPILTQLFEWKNEAWHFCKLEQSPRLSFPTFGGLRDDKALETGGARITQVKPGAVLCTEAPVKTAEESRIIERQCWTKVMKGETLVQKLVVVTSPEADNRMPFSIVWTDFSPNRKEKVKTEEAFARTEIRKNALVEALKVERIKKGWEPHGTAVATA